MVQQLHPDVREVRKKCQITNFTMPNNISSMKYALKSVPGLPDVGVLNGVGDGLVRLHPDGQSNLEKVENNPLNYLQQLVFISICARIDCCNMLSPC